jgi:catechol 2,3-dioxygenase-like lactoylglutathione lyase family enzyme
MAGIIDTHIVTQVGFIVKDIEATKKKFAAFLGVPEPEAALAGDYAITQTEVNGQPAPDANSLLAFFTVGESLQIELIQPNGVKSTWQDYLDEHGEGIHHIAFFVKGMDEKIASCEAFGMKLVQKGNYGDGGGRYAYMDGTEDLKCIVELLESF